MKEIKASTKVTGARRMASIEAARRKVRDGQVYLIRRHGAFFRRDAHGYTTHLAAAGLFSAAAARNYLDVEGLSVVPARSMVAAIIVHADDAAKASVDLRNMLFIVDPSAAHRHARGAGP